MDAAALRIWPLAVAYLKCASSKHPLLPYTPFLGLLFYRVFNQLMDFGWVAQPFLPKSHQPKQNQADRGTAKVREPMEHPVWSLVISLCTDTSNLT